MSSTKDITTFLNKESSFDALYSILVLVITCSISYIFFEGETTIAIGVGILLACLTDLPGNRQDKISTALWCIPIFIITSISVALANYHQSEIILFILASTGFIYTFITIFGARIGIVGNLGLIVASFTIGLRPSDPIIYSIALSFGCVIYFTFSLIFAHIYPYRSLKYAVEDGITNMSNLISVKVDCYDETKNLNATYKKLSIVHIQVSDKLEQIRSLLLRENQLLNSANKTTQVWLSKLYCLVDLYEQLMAIDHDYETTRELLKPTHSLPLIRIALKILTDETAKINLSNTAPSFESNKKDELLAIISQLNSINTVLSKDQKNLIDSISSQLTQILDLLSKIKSNTITQTSTWIDNSTYRDFITPKATFKSILKNLTFNSTIFLYAMRMALLLAFAGAIGYLLPEFRYASWIVLTVILVARPTFNITQRRNYQRIVGSVIGLCISIALLLVFKNNIALITFTAISVYLYLLSSRTNYLVCVIFITVAIVIFQSLYEGNTPIILSSRFAFTLIGAILSVLGCLAIPINYFRTIKNQTQILLKNFNTYLNKIQENINSEEVNYYELRLLRKSTQSTLAQSFDALEQLEKDPIIGKKYKSNIHHFQSLAYRINALLIGLAININKVQDEFDYSKIMEKMEHIQKFITAAQQLSDNITYRKI